MNYIHIGLFQATFFTIQNLKLSFLSKVEQDRQRLLKQGIFDLLRKED